MEPLVTPESEDQLTLNLLGHSVRTTCFRSLMSSASSEYKQTGCNVSKAGCVRVEL